MKAARFHGQKDIRVEEVARPGAPRPDEVVVEPLYCGICGTDLHEYMVGAIVTPTKPHPLTGVTNPCITHFIRKVSFKKTYLYRASLWL